MATIWQEWGFTKNPFTNQSLKANQEGLALLSGRDEELEELIYLLKNGNSWIPVSGNTGVGKTSLACVASFALYKEGLATNQDALYIPCDSPISVNRAESDADLQHRIARLVLKSLKTHKSDISAKKLYDLNDSSVAEIEALDTWTSAPLTGGKGGGIAGISASKTIATNTSSGFAKSFPEQVFDLVGRIFGTSGGVICIIDNCELYEDARALISTLSSLRDDVFLRRWCNKMSSTPAAPAFLTG